MRKIRVQVHGQLAGRLIELEEAAKYTFEYDSHYAGHAISQSMPRSQSTYVYDAFPPFFDGLLPEGPQLEALIKINKLDKSDLMSQIIAAGEDLVGAITIEAE